MTLGKTIQAKMVRKKKNNQSQQIKDLLDFKKWSNNEIKKKSISNKNFPIPKDGSAPDYLFTNFDETMDSLVSEILKSSNKYLDQQLKKLKKNHKK